MGRDSDGESESIFRDSSLLRFDPFFFCLLLAAEFLAIPGRDSGNRAIRASVLLRSALRFRPKFPAWSESANCGTQLLRQRKPQALKCTPWEHI